VVRGHCATTLVTALPHSTEVRLAPESGIDRTTADHAPPAAGQPNGSTMEQRPCPHCGTSNAPDASTCSWCGRSIADDGDPTEPLDRPVAGPPAGESGAPAWLQPPAGGSREAPTEPLRASEGGWGQPAQPQPPQEGSWGAPSGWQPQGNQSQGGDPGQAQWGTGAPPAPPRRGRLLWVAIAGVLVVVVLAGVAFRVVNNRAKADEPLQAPASVGGLNRIERGAVRSGLDLQEKQLRERGAKNFVVAAYGTELQPQFILVAVRDASDRARRDVIEGFDAALRQQPGGAARDQTFRRDDVDYRCLSSQLSATVAICRFDDGDIVGFGFSPGVTPQRVSELTAEARNQMTD
jgi:hypothetical protein